MRQFIPLMTIISAATLFVSQVSYAANYRGYKGENEGKLVSAMIAQAETKNVLKEGPYVGVGIGYESYKMRFSQSAYDSANVTTSFNPTLNAKGWLGSLFAGYGQYYNKFYLGGEVSANTSNASAGYALGDHLNYNSSIHVGTSFGISLLPGYKINDSSLFYAKFGYARASIKVREALSVASPAVAYSLSTTKWSNGLNYGIGLESIVYDNVSIRGEYNYINYSAFNTTTGARVTPADNQFVLSAIYHIT